MPELNEIQPSALIDARNAAVAWVESLKPGDNFHGTFREAKVRYENPVERAVFFVMAHDSLDKLMLTWEPDGMTLKTVEKKATRE